MSNYVFPALQGLIFPSTRSPQFNTGTQIAMTGKESRIAYQQYVLWNWDLSYEYLSPSDLLALQGLFIAVNGGFDTFLYDDPLFNTVTAMRFATGNGTSGPFQITATYQNPGGPGGPELVQNFNGTPQIFVNGTLQTPSSNYSLNPVGAVTFNPGSYPATGEPITWSGSFYYRVKFGDDHMDVEQFLAQMFELKKLKLKQIKL